MKTIYKYQLATDHQQFIKMPVGSKILTVQTQQEIPMLWAEVETTNKLENRDIRCYGTGFDIPEYSGIYLGTVKLLDDRIIFHYYEM